MPHHRQPAGRGAADTPTGRVCQPAGGAAPNVALLPEVEQDDDEPGARQQPGDGHHARRRLRSPEPGHTRCSTRGHATELPDVPPHQRGRVR